MKCPTCPDSDLALSSREGVEIDYCPRCRGVWLDRGELDKIIERSESTSEPMHENRLQHGYPGRDDDDYRGRRKKNPLRELLDF